MLYTILPDEMKRVERRMMEETHTPSLTLMEHAAAHVADAAKPYLQGGKLLAVCGTGNNGGDGLAAARILLTRLPQLEATIWLLPGALSPEAEEQRRKLAVFGRRIQVEVLQSGVPALPPDTACVLDAMFGTGLNRPLAGLAREAVQSLNASGLPVIAVDIPSGLSGVTGNAPVSGEASGDAAIVNAVVTVTFHRPKPGLFMGEGLAACGRVIVGDIGIAPEWDDANGLALLTKGDRLLPLRGRNTHKGDYGRVLALVGSFGMAGAAAICATAAMRSGAGLVTVACPESIVNVVQMLCPCATCLPLPPSDAEAAWQTLLPALSRADALVAGCGLGQSAYAKALVEKLIGWLQHNPLSAVLDADALNLRAAMPAQTPLGVQTVITPHVGEAARLLQQPAKQVMADQLEAARALRERYGCAVALKSASTVLVDCDGEAISLLGTPAMAKGGSGDALAGVLAALLAGQQAYGLHGVRLLQTACALHGLAGSRAAETTGERGMLATDLCAMLGNVPEMVTRESAAYHALKANPLQAAQAGGQPGKPQGGFGGKPAPQQKLAQTLRTALGRHVRVTVDRPFGSLHPKNQKMRYGLNYGYVADVLAGDNEWQDAYIWGIEEPVEFFEGVVVAVIHRLNDVEDKWIVAAEGDAPTEQEIREKTAFVEQYFQSEIIL